MYLTERCDCSVPSTLPWMLLTWNSQVDGTENGPNMGHNAGARMPCGNVWKNVRSGAGIST
jgi:hypothetical protein